MPSVALQRQICLGCSGMPLRGACQVDRAIGDDQIEKSCGRACDGGAMPFGSNEEQLLQGTGCASWVLPCFAISVQVGLRPWPSYNAALRDGEEMGHLDFSTLRS